MTYLKIGAAGDGIAAMISGADQGGVALDLIAGLVIIFAIASFLLRRSFYAPFSSTKTPVSRGTRKRPVKRSHLHKNA